MNSEIMSAVLGRPITRERRLDKEVRCYDLLDSLGIEYWRVDHEPADTMELCREVDKSLGVTMCKNLFLCNRQQTDFYLLMIPDGKVFKTKELSGQLGVSRLSFAGGEFMEKYLDITPGSLSIFGLMNDTEGEVRLLVDEELLLDENIGCHPCINTSSLRISTKDLFERVLPAMNHKMTIVKLGFSEAEQYNNI